MRTAMTRLETWAEDWQMVYNESKCKVVHFGKRNSMEEYKLNNTILEKSEQEKDIGVVVHKSLKPGEQCTKAAWMANNVLGQMARALHVRDAKTWSKLYITYIRPYLEYSTPAWNPWTRKDIEMLEKVQERALRQITSLGHLTYSEKLDRLGLSTLEDRRERADMVQVWKILHVYDDVEESKWFTRSANVANRTTRSTDCAFNIREKPFNTEIRKNFFSVRVCKPWNNIPSDIRSQNNLVTFKNQYDSWKTNN